MSFSKRWFLLALLIVCQTASGFQSTSVGGLSKEQSEQLASKLWQANADRLREQLQTELDQLEIAVADRRMKLLIKQFGEAPSTGAALYISMHGGGNAPARVNDQQWRNQIRLYQPAEGYYVAPRAPTDTWNLWHEAHIDELFDRLILAFIVCKKVDPNRVYLMGYSAGGDGVFQLAPRMADRWAAAAMMAGHPNETKADGLRNVPFALFMGGDDAAYNRNQIAGQWRDSLDSLSLADPGGYEHFVQIYPETGHWMNGRDAEVLPWFSKFKRNPWPQKIVWLQDDVLHDRLYWLGVDKSEMKERTRVQAQVHDQEIRIEGPINSVQLFLNDSLINLDQPIKVQLNDQVVFEGLVLRSEQALLKSLSQRSDPATIATAVIEVRASQ